MKPAALIFSGFLLVALMPGCLAGEGDTALETPESTALIAVITPMVIAVLKRLVQKFPRRFLPWLTPLVGMGLELIGQRLGWSAGELVPAAIAGGAGVGVREAAVGLAKGAKDKVAAGVAIVGCMVALIMLCGCSSFRSTQRDVSHVDGVRDVTTEIHARTFFDGRSDLAKLKAGQTDKSQQVALGDLGISSTASNSVQSLDRLIQLLQLAR